VPGLSNRKPKDVLLKNVAVIMEDRLREIAALVQAEIIRSGYEGKLLGGMVLTGGTALVPGVEHIFGRVTGVEEVRVGYPEHLEPNGRADLVGDPAYATAVGLVWAGYKTIDNRISFISDPTRTIFNEDQTPSAVRPVYVAPPSAGSRDKTPEKEPEENGLMAWIRRVTKPIRGNETDPY